MLLFVCLSVCLSVCECLLFPSQLSSWHACLSKVCSLISDKIHIKSLYLEIYTVKLWYIKLIFKR